MAKAGDRRFMFSFIFRKGKRRRNPNPFADAYESFVTGTLDLLKVTLDEVPAAIENWTLSKWTSGEEITNSRMVLKLAEVIKQGIKFQHDSESRSKEKTVALRGIGDFEKTFFLDGLRLWAIAHHVVEFIMNMGLVLLVSRFEGYLQQLLIVALKKWPDALTKERSLTVRELDDIHDLDDLRDQIVETEVQSVMREDIDSIDKYLARKWGIEMSTTPSWKDFKERFYRRNILIHSSAKANAIYRQKTGYSGRREVLRVSEPYFRDSIRLFRESAKTIRDGFLTSREHVPR